MSLSAPQEAALGRLKAELSDARLTPYLIAASGDLSDALARYYWNVELCCAYYPVLHALEIALRNGLDRAIAASFPIRNYDHISSWIDRQPRVAVHPGAEGQIERAKEKLLRRDPVTREFIRDQRRVHGDLVAAMSFGFWVGLLENAYEQPGTRGVWFWPDHTKTVFRSATGQTMSSLRGAFSQIRHFRNRVFHHEPVWPKHPHAPSPKDQYDTLLTALRWLAPEQASLTARVHGVPDIFDGSTQIPLMRTQLMESVDKALDLARQRREQQDAKRGHVA